MLSVDSDSSGGDDMNVCTKKLDTYITIVPSGLEEFAMQSIKDVLMTNTAMNIHTTATTTTMAGQSQQYGSKFICDIKDLSRSSPTSSSSSSSLSSDQIKYVKDQIIQQRMKRKRKAEAKAATKKKGKGNDINAHNDQIILHSLQVYQEQIFGTARLDVNMDMDIDINSDMNMNMDADKNTTTTTTTNVKNNASTNTHTTKEVNVGFHNKDTITSTPGSFEGKSVIQFRTNAPPKVVARIRAMGCGPLLTVIVSSQNDENGDEDDDDDDDVNINTSIRLTNQQTVEEASKSIASYITKDSTQYADNFYAALELWSRHAREVWFESEDVIHHQSQSAPTSTSSSTRSERNVMNGATKKRTRDDSMKQHQNKNDTINECESASASTSSCINIKRSLHTNLDMKVKGELDYKYRISCIRTYSTDYNYKRDDLIPHLANVLIPTSTTTSSTSSTDSDDGKGRRPPTFTVDLKGYDFEVLIMIDKNALTVAVPLNYYQYVGARGYSSGKIPPDITPPYITGEISKTVIRLRPSIANLLYHVSGTKKGDIVMDPCAGVGTILVEGSFRGCFSLGGDLVLSGSEHEDTCRGVRGHDDKNCDNSLAVIVQDYFKNAERCRQLLNNGNSDSDNGSAEILSWDAALIPIRDGSVDCIISDLPFGQKCMSTSKLEAFFPLLFSECARCLRKNTGRMTLLCGSFQCVLEALAKCEREKTLFEIPDAIMPVNIGGLSAWIIKVRRNGNSFIPLKNHKQRVIKMARGRLQSMKGKKRAQA